MNLSVIGMNRRRGADALRIAQQFIAGMRRTKLRQSAKRTTDDDVFPSKTLHPSRPLHGPAIHLNGFSDKSQRYFR
jgi:hypothetical protein